MNLRLVEANDDAAALKALDEVEEILDRFEKALSAGDAAESVRARLDLADWPEDEPMAFPKTENDRVDRVDNRMREAIARWREQREFTEWKSR